MGVLQRSRQGKHWENPSPAETKHTHNAPPQEVWFPSCQPSLGLQPCRWPGGLWQLHPQPFPPDMRPLNNFLRPINFGLRDIFHFGPRTNAAFRKEGTSSSRMIVVDWMMGKVLCALGTQRSA